jgi:CheY-like chemotaxis protein
MRSLPAEAPYPVPCRASILFAEDDPAIRLIVAELLAADGYLTTAVETGDEAALLLKSQRFDLLLTDVRMPGLKDGIELATSAWIIDPELPVVIVSGFARELTQRFNELTGNVRFLAKPFRFGELIKIIRACLNSPLLLGAEPDGREPAP